ncbi:hypothetical protein IAQ61_007469 [Plenodomus lingam]|uniref:Predicted protein n=1 Tax=Leptosphaeria maculans (strain JN3 / isolate v23.1.3 / race Av1-4-5-6-7-8) TaxID=985895 RepID=E5A5M2_LEPMJ|nr:predicted protein [Plenodomus lingam JN3]KAH9866880.1 hypothetical protein IAQ61_007469 [Plenodomus lingam]CBX98920.1 predicted protein [Plenodomus lingam JN3]
MCYPGTDPQSEVVQASAIASSQDESDNYDIAELETLQTAIDKTVWVPIYSIQSYLKAGSSIIVHLENAYFYTAVCPVGRGSSDFQGM